MPTPATDSGTACRHRLAYRTVVFSKCSHGAIVKNNITGLVHPDTSGNTGLLGGVWVSFVCCFSVGTSSLLPHTGTVASPSRPSTAAAAAAAAAAWHALSQHRAVLCRTAAPRRLLRAVENVCAIPGPCFSGSGFAGFFTSTEVPSLGPVPVLINLLKF